MPGICNFLGWLGIPFLKGTCTTLFLALTEQGNALDMLEDINTGISWVLHRIGEFGGDSANVHLCGQSAGGHLAAVALLSQVCR